MTTQVVWTLNNNYRVPALGLGTYECDAGVVENVIKMAIDVGYRHIDTAWIYDNEKEIGKAIRDKIADGTLQRHDLFVTTKIWNNWHAKESVLPKLVDTLVALQLDYVDLFVMHWPIAFKENGRKFFIDEDCFSDIDYLETWKGMEACVDARYARNIGLSNFNSHQIERILANARIKPVVNYVEVNPYMNQKKLIDFCRERRIQVVGYCPFACSESEYSKGFPESTINDASINAICERLNKTPNQVVLNYLIYELGIAVTPKTIHPFRLQENIGCFDFRLSPEDVDCLNSLNKNERTLPYLAYRTHPHYPFNIEF